MENFETKLEWELKKEYYAFFASEENRFFPLSLHFYFLFFTWKVH